eukprot:TRINITY_DN67078_c4_g1_i3.p1 TRINITY_DN67078_c4_g1~~TRINITY_DN67078_c4_g1_i3.p1  ORF type:complete len:674 (-),score=332.69 TRINITY_DN67078_c4_g1_i3:17-2014(-)
MAKNKRGRRGKKKQQQAAAVSSSSLVGQKRSLASDASSSGREKRQKPTAASRVKKPLESYPRLGSGRKILKSSAIPRHLRGRALFEWLIAPMSVEEFFAQHWEREPLLIQRNSRSETPVWGDMSAEHDDEDEDEDEEEEEEEEDDANGDTNAKDHNNKGKESEDDYYKGWFHTSDLETLVEQGRMHYSRDLNITRYVDGVRETLDPGKQVKLPQLRKFLRKKGCSARVLCPQRYMPKMWHLLSALEEFFGYGCGCNVYVTPAGTQGFAPHYDEIEAFVLQVEGAKRWRLYHPRSEAEQLDRWSSGNFSQEEIGEPFLDVVLRPGDLLYFPRGTIHQAVSTPDEHSLHMTISTGMRNTYHDYLLHALPAAVELASQENHSMRESLPHRYMDYMGLIHADADSDDDDDDDDADDDDGGDGGDDGGDGDGNGHTKSKKEDNDRQLQEKRALREQFKARVLEYARLVLDSIPFDQAADQMVKALLHDRLPPPYAYAWEQHEEDQDQLDDAEADAATPSSVKIMKMKRKECIPSREGKKKPLLGNHSYVRMIGPDVARVVLEDDKISLYHCVSNGKLYRLKPPQCLVFSVEYGPALEKLLTSFPEMVHWQQLPCDNDEEREALVHVLWENYLVDVLVVHDQASNKKSDEGAKKKKNKVKKKMAAKSSFMM